MTSRFEIERQIFLKERRELVEEVQKGMDRIIGGFNQLNINLEALERIGIEYDEASKLWHIFMGETVKIHSRDYKPKLDPFVKKRKVK